MQDKYSIFKISILTTSLMSLSIISMPANAIIYKWTNSKGITQYSDKSPLQIPISKKPTATTSPQLSALMAAQSFCSATEPTQKVAITITPTKPKITTPSIVFNNNRPFKIPFMGFGFKPVKPIKTPTVPVVTAPTSPPTAPPVTTTPSIPTPPPTVPTAPVQPPIITPTTPTPPVIIEPPPPVVVVFNPNGTTTPTTPTMPTVMDVNDGTMGMPKVNISLAPAPVIGYNTIKLLPHDHVPVRNTGANDLNGEFRIQCAFSHMLNDDSIVFPNQPGRAHLHTFFGNNNADSKSTPESLKAAGNSTCDGGIMNRSAYWVPTVIDTRTGRPIKPAGSNIYYKTGDRTRVVPPPLGLRMISGNMKASSTQPDNKLIWWCGDKDDNNVSGGNSGNIPYCAVGNHLVAVIRFPYWWDGKNLDSTDHKSHMSHTEDATHNVLIPEITFNIRYNIQEGDDTNQWRLSSDMYSNELRGGYSLHGDWMNGWITDPVTGKNFSTIFTEQCLQAGMNCGNALLGDGRQFLF